MKAGFVNIFGKPNAGKSTLLNALLGEKLAIVSHKVQTTRHRIKGILTTEEYQVIFSDTPGIIEPEYKLHERMMGFVKESLKDADVAVFLVDAKDDMQASHEVFSKLKTGSPIILAINKIDKVPAERIEELKEFFKDKAYAKNIIEISALSKTNIDGLMAKVVELTPEGHPYFDEDQLTDLPTRFFIGEMIREKIFQLYHEEIPYQCATLVREFKDKDTLIKIMVDIIVQRETQKGIILGKGGQMIKQLGTEARKDMEQFLDKKVFLELFVKVRPNWREKDIYLKEYGY